VIPTVYRFVELARILGPRRAGGIALRWLLRREYLVFCRDLRLPLPDIPVPVGLAWTAMTEPDIPRLRAVNPLMTEREVRRRIRAGQTCLLGWLDDRLAHYRWDATGPLWLPYLGKRFQPLSGDAIGDESFTHPAFRGRGIDACGVQQAYRAARTQGCTRSITLVARWNAASRRTQAKAGRRMVGSVGYRLLGLEKRYFVTGLAYFDDRGAFSICNEAERPRSS
jgi:GNAT superfamily N-acetyltransferase